MEKGIIVRYIFGFLGLCVEVVLVLIQTKYTESVVPDIAYYLVGMFIALAFAGPQGVIDVLKYFRGGK